MPKKSMVIVAGIMTLCLMLANNVSADDQTRTYQGAEEKNWISKAIGTRGAIAEPMKTGLKDREQCSPTGQPNQCYGNGTSCKAVVLICHGCCYDARGYSKGETSEICGACFGWDF